MTSIKTLGLTKKFKGRTAVDSINLSVEKGEIFALLGQNGAGKTTAIKMMCCLIPPTEGDAILSGESIVKNPDKVKRKINVSPQETAVAANLSVRENLEFIAQIYGSDKNLAVEKAEKSMRDLGLSERSEDKAKTLSGGLQRRLSIAMALISEPEILFLDEPTLGLDIRARRDLWSILSSLKGKITIVLTTHYLEEAEVMSDTIAIMDKGKIKMSGTLEYLKSQTGKDSLDEIFLALTEPEVTK